MNVYIMLLIVVLGAFVVVVVFKAMNRPDPRHPHNWPAPSDGGGASPGHDASSASHVDSGSSSGTGDGGAH